MAETVGSPPVWLNEEGQEAWRFLVEQLGDELLTRDRLTFTQLCATYGMAEAAAKDIHLRGVLTKARTKDHSADTEDEDGDREPAYVKNPAVQIVREAQIQFLNFAKEFGLTPGARKRMQLELKKAGATGPAPKID